MELRMLTQIKGLHHVTAMARSAPENNAFWAGTLGLRRVKQTVNFDDPSVYHLYYGDEAGTPGSVMTYFPFPHMARGRPGTGEVGTTVFSVPEGSLEFWSKRLTAAGLRDLKRDESFGEKRLHFAGPDGDSLALVEDKNDVRRPWTQGGVPAEAAIRGFHSASLRLRDEGATEELLKFMGYEIVDTHDGIKRLIRREGNGADFVDLETLPGVARGDLGAGSVHHIAFAVPTRVDQLVVRKSLMDTGYQLTPVIDRDYFFSVYFRTPGGVLFEIATNEPGFDHDEDTAHLGEALKLPKQHEHLRARLEKALEPLGS
jgi:glyoxalase family protein